MVKINGLWQDFENHLLNEGLTELRRSKLKGMFNVVQRGLKGKLATATREDIEGFLNRLNRNDFNKLDGNPFSGSTKADIKKFLKQFFKWYKGNNEEYPKQVSWIKARISKDERPEEKPVLTIEEVQKLANSFNRAEFRLLTLLLFDSGFRIQEILSAKKNDLTWEAFDDDGNNCFWINCNVSKTIKRKVPVPLFSEDIKNFCNGSYFESRANDAPLFDVSYNFYLKKLKQNSMELFGKKVTCHALRHSSATYYSIEYGGNMNLIAQRYGWSLSSKELATYIRRSGSYQREGAKKSYTNQMVKLETSFNQEKKRREEIENKLKELMQQVKDLKPSHDKVIQGIKDIDSNLDNLKKGDKITIKGKTYTLK